MTNDGWGKEWPVTMRKLESYEPTKDNLITKDDLAGGPVFVYKCQDNPKGDINFGLMKLEKVYNNLHPTHDPYTNPDSQIYYQCNCGAILDPGTKSFAALNNCAMNTGWKVRWGADSYQPYCVECGKDVE